MISFSLKGAQVSKLIPLLQDYHWQGCQSGRRFPLEDLLGRG